MLFSLVCLGGVLLGALPGISPTLAVALAIPLTFGLEPGVGLAILGGLYVSTIFGGAITAILFGVPGAPANIATTFDGYPLAKQGKALPALICSSLSSLLGGLIGGGALLGLLYIQFDLSHFVNYGTFILAASLGIVLALLEAKHLPGAIVSIGLGISAASVGYGSDGEVHYAPTSDFFGGLPIVPVLLAVFVFPQVIGALALGRDNPSGGLSVSALKADVAEGLWWPIKGFKHLVCGSIVGTLIGLLPGVGGQISGIAAHSLSRSKLLRKDETFFDGNPNGVVGVEASNNAMVAPSLIPLLTMGIPGSPTAAIIGGSLLMYGLVPGPGIFTAQNAALDSFVFSMLAACFISSVGLILLAPLLSVMIRVPPIYIAISILCLSIVGLSLMSFSAFDIFIFSSLGLFYIIFNATGLNPTQIILSFLLWPLIEQNWLLVSSVHSGASLLSYLFVEKLNWIWSLGFLIATVFVLKKFRFVSVNDFHLKWILLSLLTSVTFYLFGFVGSVLYVSLGWVLFIGLNDGVLAELIRRNGIDIIGLFSLILLFSISPQFIIAALGGWMIVRSLSVGVVPGLFSAGTFVAIFVIVDVL